jgi:hypothetical protein
MGQQMRRKALITIGILAAIFGGIGIFWWVKLPKMTLTPVEPMSTSVAPLEQRSTNSQDREFTERVLPAFRAFLSTLNRAGVNPFNEPPSSFSAVRFMKTEHAMVCRFLVGEGWAATYLEVPKKSFHGITQFGQTGPDNAFRAISHANTNALGRLSQSATKMPEAEAQRILIRIADAFGVDRSKHEKPEIYPEKMFDYDLGLWTAQYRRKGTDPINQLNYAFSFSIKATSPTTAVLAEFTRTTSMD